MYVCDEQGYQTSPNILYQNGKWITQNRYLNRNWSWRPYFLENILKMRNEKRVFYLICIPILKRVKQFVPFPIQLIIRNIFSLIYPIAIYMKMMVYCKEKRRLSLWRQPPLLFYFKSSSFFSSSISKPMMAFPLMTTVGVE